MLLAAVRLPHTSSDEEPAKVPVNPVRVIPLVEAVASMVTVPPPELASNMVFIEEVGAASDTAAPPDLTAQ